MTELAAQAIKRIKQLPVLTVYSKMNSVHTVADLLHPDAFVADSRVTLRTLLSDYSMRMHFLGERIADMNIDGSFYPLGLKYMYATEKVRLTNGDDEQSLRVVDPLDRAMHRFHSLDLNFAVVDVAELPTIGASHFVSAVVEDDAAILIAIDGPVSVKVMPTFKPAITVDPNTAAIIPPRSPIFMQGARSMLIRPIFA